MTTHYRIICHPDAATGFRWFYPQFRTWWTLGIWFPLAFAECSQGAAQRHIDIAKGVTPRPPSKVVHEETVP